MHLLTKISLYQLRAVDLPVSIDLSSQLHPTNRPRKDDKRQWGEKKSQASFIMHAILRVMSPALNFPSQLSLSQWCLAVAVKNRKNDLRKDLINHQNSSPYIFFALFGLIDSLSSSSLFLSLVLLTKTHTDMYTGTHLLSLFF